VVLEDPAERLVHALKYEGWLFLADFLGRRVAALSPSWDERPLVVPVPTTPSRRRARGYNQAKVLAVVVARELGFSLVDGLERQEGRTQVRLAPRSRAENVRGAFRPLRPFRSRMRGREVILIDDVLTTGATAASAALALGEGGASGVHLFTFARALPFTDEVWS
jgi:ComF family protein